MILFSQSMTLSVIQNYTWKMARNIIYKHEKFNIIEVYLYIAIYFSLLYSWIFLCIISIIEFRINTNWRWNFNFNFCLIEDSFQDLNKFSMISKKYENVKHIKIIYNYWCKKAVCLNNFNAKYDIF